jgi:hypothetical protein
MSANGHNDECATNSRWADWLGIQIELIGWEDLQVLRPTQAQIKLDLDRCGAFIAFSV